MITPTILVLGADGPALSAAREVVRQGGKAVLLRSGARSCDLRQPSGIDVVCSELVSVERRNGRFVAILEDGAIGCDAGVLVDELDWAVDASPVTTLSLQDPVPDGTREVLIDLLRGPDRQGRAAALRTAVELRTREPRPKVVVLVDEVLAYGMDELLLKRAQALGVVFLRPGGPPSWEGSLVEVKDALSGATIRISPDLVLREGRPIHKGHGRARALFVPWDASSGTARATVAKGVASTLREGVFLVRSNLLDQELETDVRSAVARAITYSLSPISHKAAARVDQDKCSACLTCVRTCPFSAPSIGEKGKAEVQEDLCQACGKCVSACPSRALSLDGTEDLDAMVRRALEGGP